MKLKALKALTAFGLPLVVILSSCATPPATTTTPTSMPTTGPATSITQKPTATQTGPFGELRVGLSTLGEEKFDPVRSSQTNVSMVISPLFDFLFRLDGTKLAPGIVEKWELSEDGLSWIYHIRQGIKFHNGSDLKADDVKFSIEQYAGADSFYAEIRNMVKSVLKIDDYTIQISTNGKQPYLPFIQTFFTPNQGTVLPKDYFEQNGAEYFNRKPVGEGPFKFVRHVPGDNVEYQAVENHWRQTPAFKKLMIVMIPEETTRTASLKTGGLDVVECSIEDAIELEAAGLRSYTMSASVTNVYLYGAYAPQVAGKPIADIRVRRALSLAINRDEIIKTFFYGKAGPPPPPSLTDIVVDIDYPAWMDYAAKMFNYDPDQAKQLLKEAGYQNGFNIKIWSYTMGGSPYLPKLAQVVQGYWEKIGVKAELVPTDWGAFKSIRTAGPNRTPIAELVGQASLVSNSPSPIPSRQLRTPFRSNSVFDLVGTAMPELDKLLDDSLSETDSVKRNDMVTRAIKMSTETYVCLVIATVPEMSALGPAVDIDFPKPAPAMSFYFDLAKHRK